MIRRCPAGPHLPVGLHVLLAVERGLKRLLAVGAHVGAEVVVDAQTNSMDMGLVQELVMDREAWRAVSSAALFFCLQSGGKEWQTTPIFLP